MNALALAKKTAIVPSDPPALNQTNPLTDASGNGDRLAAELRSRGSPPP